MRLQPGFYSQGIVKDWAQGSDFQFRDQGSWLRFTVRLMGGNLPNVSDGTLSPKR